MLRGNEALSNESRRLQDSSSISNASELLSVAQKFELDEEFKAAASLLQQVFEIVLILKEKTERIQGLLVVASNAVWMSEAALEKGYLYNIEAQLTVVLAGAVSELETHKSDCKSNDSFARDLISCLVDFAVFFINIEDYHQALNVVERALKLVESNEKLSSTKSFGRCVHCKAYSLEMLGRHKLAKEEYVHALRVLMSAEEMLTKEDSESSVASLMTYVKNWNSKDLMQKVLSPQSKHRSKRK